MDNVCPRCGIISPSSAPRCSCGWVFDRADPAPQPPRQLARWRWIGWMLVAVSWLAVPMCGVKDSDLSFGEAAIVVWLVGLVGGMVLCVRALMAKSRIAFLQAVLAWAGFVVAFFVGASNFHYSRGRQLFRGRKRILPSRTTRTTPVLGTGRQTASALWVHNGDTEWVSVAAFAKLSLDLTQLGAPLDLVERSHEDALDEIRHARMCWTLAGALDPGRGAMGEPASMPDLAKVRRGVPTLALLAAESLVQGAYLERVSADLAGALLQRVAFDDVGAVLAAIRDDELRHSEHAWEVVAWCASKGDPSVFAALERAGRLPAPRFDARAVEAGGAFECFGIAGHHLQRAVEAAVRASIAARLRRVLDEARGLDCRAA